MTRPWRSAFVLTMLAAAACGPLLGLDDLHENVVPPKDEGGTADGAADAAPQCTRNAECIAIARGSPALCVAGQCRTVNKELCLQQVLPDNAILERDDVVVAASFLLIGGSTNALATGPGLAYSLALKEIQAAGGILGTTHHELAMIVCKAEPVSVQKSLDHVIKELRLPVIVANFGSGDLSRLVPTVVDAGVFTLNPSVTTDALKFASTKRLVWSLLGTAEDVARAYRPLVLELQKEKLANAPIKVAMVATNGSLDQPMADLLEKGQLIPTPDAGGVDTSKALDINGDPPTNNASFLRVDIDSNELPKPDPQKLEDAKTQLKNFQPDVIIALTADELDSFVEDVDDALVAAKGGASKTPYWILGPNNGATIHGGHVTTLGKHLSPVGSDTIKRAVRARFVGVQYAGAVDTTQRDAWRGRMTKAYGDAGAEGLASENFYDAVYWLAYGIAAAGPDAPVEGKSFQLGVRNLLRGQDVLAGPRATVQDSFRVINMLQPATFVGALGPPDINEAAGTWNSVGGVYCYPPPGAGPLPKYDVRRYEVDGGQLSPEGGPVNCTRN